jgi:hypothetical protein
VRLSLGLLHPLATGLAATAVAIAAMIASAALGSVFLRRVNRDDPVWLASAIVIGAALNSALLALLTRARVVGAGAAIVAALGVIAIVVRRATLADAIRSGFAAIRKADRRWTLALCVLGVVAWLYAIAPPREADAMRYHLAHLRQIISDGQWQPIADFHYALPFAWSLNFLPFELIHLPQAAQLTSLLLLVVLSASLIRIANESTRSTWALVLVALLVAHPFVVRTFTSPTADPYAVLVVFTAGVLLLRVDNISGVEARLLGFVSWIGVGSRYQLIAWAVIVTAWVVWRIRNRARNRELLGAFGTGAVAALVLASPFYVANLATFGNPVWPLFVSRESAAVDYASAIARRYSDALSSGFSPRLVLEQLMALVTPGPAVPIAAGIMLVCIAGLFSRRAARNLAVTSLLFVLMWLPVAWPFSYPRLVLPMIGAAILIALELPGRDWKPPKVFVGALIFAVIAMGAATAYAGVEYFRYDATGNSRRFHRYTWFYDVYDWINRTTPKNSRFLVIVYSGHSYYLDRPYRRADPWLSGVVDWRRVSTAEQLDSVLSAGSYQGLIYQFRDWTRYEGGKQMMGAVDDAVNSGYLAVDTVFHEKLYTSRMAGRYEVADVAVLTRRKGVR